jgi:hypothetical protein
MGAAGAALATSTHRRSIQEQQAPEPLGRATTAEALSSELLLVAAGAALALLEVVAP